MSMLYVEVIVGEKENLILGHIRNDFCCEIVVMGHFKVAPRETGTVSNCTMGLLWRVNLDPVSRAT